MIIGIIGTGYIGGTLIKKLSALGHEVKIADARGAHIIPEISGAPASRWLMLGRFLLE
jgi:predicted dinucleotide-binding enzyme